MVDDDLSMTEIEQRDGYLQPLLEYDCGDRSCIFDDRTVLELFLNAFKQCKYTCTCFYS